MLGSLFGSNEPARTLAGFSYSFSAKCPSDFVLGRVRSKPWLFCSPRISRTRCSMTSVLNALSRIGDSYCSTSSSSSISGTFVRACILGTAHNDRIGMHQKTIMPNKELMISITVEILGTSTETATETITNTNPIM